MSRPRAALARADVLLVVALTVLAFALRWACVHQSLFGDELFLYAIVHDRSLDEVMSTVRATEKTPPLFFLVAWALDHAGGVTVMIRLGSVVASVATVPLVFLLGRRTVGAGAGLFAAAWFALSPFAIFYGSEARGYATVVALVVGATLALLTALERDRTRWWVAYAVAAVAALYVHYIAGLVLVPLALWALAVHRERLRPQLLASAGIVLAYLPWLPGFLVQAGNSDEEAARLHAIAPLTPSWLGAVVSRVLVSQPFLAPGALFGRVALAGLLLALLVVVAAAARWLLAARRAGTPTGGPELGLLALLAVVPLVTIVLYSTRPNTSFLLPRNVSVGLPYALLCIGWALSRLPRPAALGAAALALACLATGTVATLQPDHQRTDGQDAARFIDAHAGPDTPVLDVQFPYTGPPGQGTRIHLRRPHRLIDRPQDAWAAAVRGRHADRGQRPAHPRARARRRPARGRRRALPGGADARVPGLRPILTRVYLPR